VIDKEAHLEVLTSISRLDYPGMANWVSIKFKEAVNAYLASPSSLPHVIAMLQTLEAMVANTKTQRTVLGPEDQNSSELIRCNCGGVGSCCPHDCPRLRSLQLRRVHSSAAAEGLSGACLSFIKAFIRTYFSLGVQLEVIEGIHTPIARHLGLNSPNDSAASSLAL
jgi:hypothetical protein